MDEITTIEAHRFMQQEGMGVDQTAAYFEVSVTTLKRGFKRMGLDYLVCGL